MAQPLKWTIGTYWKKSQGGNVKSHIDNGEQIPPHIMFGLQTDPSPKQSRDKGLKRSF